MANVEGSQWEQEWVHHYYAGEVSVEYDEDSLLEHFGIDLGDADIMDLSAEDIHEYIRNKSRDIAREWGLTDLEHMETGDTDSTGEINNIEINADQGFSGDHADGCEEWLETLQEAHREEIGDE